MKKEKEEENTVKVEAPAETKELTLDDILSNIKEINDAKNEKEVTITHKRLKADFRFLVPELSELTHTTNKEGTIDLNEVFKVLSLNLLTKITDKMLEALEVADQASALKKLFTHDEILIVFANLMEGVEEQTVVIKKK